MATSLSTMSLLKNAWAITKDNAHDVFGEHEYIDNVKEVFLLEIPRGSNMRAGATTFESAFDVDNAEHVFTEATMQLVMHSIELMRAAYDADQLKSAQTSAQLDGDPFVVCLEAVIADRVDERLPPPIIDRSGERLFMRNVPDNVPVVAYRLWLFVRVADTRYDFGKFFLESIKVAGAAYTDFVNPGAARRASRAGPGGASSSSTGPDAQGDVGVSLSSYAGAEGVKFGQSLNDTNKWHLIRSLLVWSHVACQLYGFKRWSRPKALARVTNNATALNDNPAHPRYVLTPYMYFEHPHKYACAEQRDIGRYCVFANKSRWQFARHDCVTKLSPADQSIVRLRKKLFPDYQARIVGDASIDHAYALARAREVSHLRRRIVGSNRSAVAERPMIHQPLNFGTGGDLDRVAPDAARVADVNESGFTGERFGAARRRNVPPGMLNDDDDDDDDEEEYGEPPEGETVRGGTDFASIMRMIRSVPNTTPAGDYELTDPSILLREDFESSASLAARRLRAATDSPDRSHLHLVLHSGARLMGELSTRIAAGGMTQEEKRAEYVHARTHIIRLYEDLCMDRSSKISEEGAKIAEWYDARRVAKREWLGHDEPVLDASMSTFGNLVTRRMNRLESVKFVTFAHLMTMTILFGTLDAYRHEFDLHFNALVTGPPSTGKSFICELLRDLRIAGTVAKVDDETGRASYTDDDHNDRTVYSEEVKPDHFRSSAMGGNDTAEASFKEMLTSQVRVLKTFTKLDDGKRSSRIVYSQQIMSFVGCSNLDHRTFTPAIQSRFSCWHFVESRRNDRCTSDMQGVEKTLTAETRARQAEFVDELCAEQFLHYHVEKLIAAHALTDVTMTAFDSIKQIVRRYLSERYNLNLKTRTIARAQMLLRKLVISVRLEQLYSSPASEFYRKDFSVYQLASLDDLLYDDEEMACWALEALRHEIIDKQRPHFLALLKRTYIAPRLADIAKASDAGNRERLLESIYMLPSTLVRKRRYGGGGIVAPPNNDQHKRLAEWAPRDYDEQPTHVDESKAEDTYGESHMYAYYRFEATSASIARRIVAESAGSSTELSSDDVIAYLRTMAKDYVKSDRYRWHENVPVIDATKPRTMIPALIYTHDAIFIALQLFSDKDPLTDAIEFARSAALQSPRKYLTATIYDDEHPYLLKTTLVRPEHGTVHHVTQYGRQMTAASYFSFASLAERNSMAAFKVSNGTSRLTLHYDDMSRRDRARALFHGRDSMPDVRSYEAYERERVPADDPLAAVRTQRYVLRAGGSYPDIILAHSNANDDAVLDDDSGW